MPRNHYMVYLITSVDLNLLTVKDDDVDQHWFVRSYVLPTLCIGFHSACLFLCMCICQSVCMSDYQRRCLSVSLVLRLSCGPWDCRCVPASVSLLTLSLFLLTLWTPFPILSVPQPMSWPRAANAFVTMQFSFIVQLLITKAIAPRAPNKDASFRAKLPTSGAFEDTSASFFDVRLWWSDL